MMRRSVTAITNRLKEFRIKIRMSSNWVWLMRTLNSNLRGLSLKEQIEKSTLATAKRLSR
jgi:hypothetical protein